MAKRIKFELLGNAKSVSEHLYNVQLEGNCLVFSEFDEEAFDLAIALEDLDESAYNVIQNHCTTPTFAENRLTIQQAEQLYYSPKHKITIGLVEAGLEGFDIPPSFSFTCFNWVLSQTFEEAGSLVASLVINTELLEFMSLLLFSRERQGSPLNIRAVPQKVELTVKNLRSNRPKLLLPGLLKVFNDNQTKEIEFHFSNIVLERIRF